MKPVGAKLPEGTGERSCDGMRAQWGMRHAPSARFMQAFTTNLEGNTPAPPGWAPPASQHLAASGELGSVIWEAMGAARGRPTPRGPWLMHETASPAEVIGQKDVGHVSWFWEGTLNESNGEAERGRSHRKRCPNAHDLRPISPGTRRWRRNGDRDLCGGRALALSRSSASTRGLKDCGVQRQSSKAASRVSDQSEHDSGSESAASRSI